MDRVHLTDLCVKSKSLRRMMIDIHLLISIARILFLFFFFLHIQTTRNNLQKLLPTRDRQNAHFISPLTLLLSLFISLSFSLLSLYNSITILIAIYELQFEATNSRPRHGANFKDKKNFASFIYNEPSH